LADFLVVVLAYQAAAMLKAFNVLTGNTYIHIFDFNLRLVLCFFNGTANGINRVLDVGYHATLHSDRLGAPISQYLNLSVLRTLSYYCCNFGCPDIETDNYV